jgi:hypothetical protein
MVREHMVEEGMTHHLKNMGNSIIRKALSSPSSLLPPSLFSFALSQRLCFCVAAFLWLWVVGVTVIRTDVLGPL